MNAVNTTGAVGGGGILTGTQVSISTTTELQNACQGVLLYSYQTPTAAIAVLSFIFGIVFCLFGYRCFRASMFLIGLVFSSVLLYAVCHQMGLLTTAANSAIAVVSGLLFGIITMLVQHVGLLVTGFNGGLFLATAALVVLEQFYHPSTLWIPLGTLFFSGLLMAAATLHWQKGCTILATALFGSAMIMVCIDYFLEVLAMVLYMWDRFVAAEATSVCWYSWAILGAWPLLFLLGVVIQAKVTAKNYSHKGVVTSNASKRKKKANLQKMRERETLDRTNGGYRYVYKARNFKGDIVSKAYMNSFERFLSPQAAQPDSHSASGAGGGNDRRRGPRRFHTRPSHLALTPQDSTSLQMEPPSSDTSADPSSFLPTRTRVYLY